MSAMNKAEEKNISKEHEIYLKSVKASKRKIIISRILILVIFIG